MNDNVKNPQNENETLNSNKKKDIIENTDSKKAQVAAPHKKFKFTRKRDGRIPLEKRRKLTVLEKKDGLFYCWKNESSNDFTQLQEDGYAFVNKSDNEPRDCSMPSQDGNIVRRPVGNGEYAYLMCTKQEWKEERDQEKRDYNDSMMKQIGKTGLDCIPISQIVGKVEVISTSKEEK